MLQDSREERKNLKVLFFLSLPSPFELCSHFFSFSNTHFTLIQRGLGDQDQAYIAISKCTTLDRCPMMDQDSKTSQPETREGRPLTNIDALLGELTAQVVEQVRSWTLVEDDEEREEMRS